MCKCTFDRDKLSTERRNNMAKITEKIITVLILTVSLALLVFAMYLYYSDQ